MAGKVIDAVYLVDMETCEELCGMTEQEIVDGWSPFIGGLACADCWAYSYNVAPTELATLVRLADESDPGMPVAAR